MKHLIKDSKFNCLKNCIKCCGYVLIPKKTYLANKDKQQVSVIKEVDMGDKIGPLTQDLRCVFLNRQTQKCMIYEQRPQICKDFGLVKDLPCPFLLPNGERREQ